MLPRIPRVSTYGTVDGALDSNEEGLVVYNTSAKTIMLWNGTDWGALKLQDGPYFTEVSLTATSTVGAPFTLTGGFAGQLVTYDSVDVNVGGAGSWFDTSTSTFTPQKAGWWQITASFDIFRGPADETSLSIIKNGASICQVGGVGAIVSAAIKEVYFDGISDSIQIIIFGAGTASRNQEPHTSFFQARLISE